MTIMSYDGSDKLIINLLSLILLELIKFFLLFNLLHLKVKKTLKITYFLVTLSNNDEGCKKKSEYLGLLTPNYF